MHKGQVISTEFLFSLSILMILFMAGIYLWNLTSARVGENIIKNELVSSSIDISDQLLKLQGLPTDWESNISKIFSLGLSKESYILDVTKVKAMLVNLSYNQVKDLLNLKNQEFYFRMLYPDGNFVRIGGIPREPVAYYARQYPSDTEIFKLLNKSGFIWDIYWRSGNSLPSGMIPNTARNVYAVNDGKQAVKWVIENLSNYNSVFFEDVHNDWDIDLNTTEQQALRSFVNATGHIYFQVQHREDFLSLFGINPSGVSSHEGTIVNLDDVLNNVSIGTNVTFQTGTKSFDIATSPYPIKVLMTIKNDPTKCLFCKWTYSKGYIYYIPDINTTTNNFVPGLDIVGVKAEFGLKPTSSASNIVDSRRIVLFGGNFVYMDVIIWK